MMSRGLVKRMPAEDGFLFVAEESAAPFISSLAADYSCRLRERAEWVVGRFHDVSTEEIRRITHRLFDRWSSEFQLVQSSGGGQ